MVFHTFVEGSLMTAASRRVVIVTVEPTDHQAVLETLSRHHGTRAAAAAAIADGRIVRLHPLRRGHDHVDASPSDRGSYTFPVFSGAQHAQSSTQPRSIQVCSR